LKSVQGRRADSLGNGNSTDLALVRPEVDRRAIVRSAILQSVMKTGLVSSHAPAKVEIGRRADPQALAGHPTRPRQDRKISGRNHLARSRSTNALKTVAMIVATARPIVRRVRAALRSRVGLRNLVASRSPTPRDLEPRETGHAPIVHRPVNRALVVLRVENQVAVPASASRLRIAPARVVRPHPADRLQGNHSPANRSPLNQRVEDQPAASRSANRVAAGLLLLAAGAKVGPPLGDEDLPDRAAAVSARLPFAAIDFVFDLEPAAFAFGVHVV